MHCNYCQLNKLKRMFRCLIFRRMLRTPIMTHTDFLQMKAVKRAPPKLEAKGAKKIKPNVSLDAFIKPSNPKNEDEAQGTITNGDHLTIAESHFIHEPKQEDITPFDKDKITIMHWNVNSLNARLDNEHFKKYFDSHDFDIICFNETKFSGKKFREMKIEQSPYWFNKYYQYWSFSTKKQGYSGVCILTKIKPISVTFGLNKHLFDSEGRVVTAEFDEFYLISVYVPNSGSKLDRLDERVTEWESHFREYIKGLAAKKGVIVVGDLNVAHENKDVANYKTAHKYAGFTDKERKCFNELLEIGMKDVFREHNPDQVIYTYWDQRSNARQKNLGWRIDYCLADEKMFPKIAKVQIKDKVLGSDHCPVEVVIHKNTPDKVEDK